LHTHGGTFDVPAGASGAPGGIPFGLVGLGGFPECEVGGVALAAALKVAGAGFLFFGAAVGELAVVGVLGDVEPDIAVGGVGEALFDQLLDQRDDLGHVLAGLGKAIDGIDAQAGEGVEII